MTLIFGVLWDHIMYNYERCCSLKISEAKVKSSVHLTTSRGVACILGGVWSKDQLLK